MKISDIWKMSSDSLWKRKLRSILTILGVVIGTLIATYATIIYLIQILWSESIG